MYGEPQGSVNGPEGLPLGKMPRRVIVGSVPSDWTGPDKREDMNNWRDLDNPGRLFSLRPTTKSRQNSLLPRTIRKADLLGLVSKEAKNPNGFEGLCGKTTLQTAGFTTYLTAKATHSPQTP